MNVDVKDLIKLIKIKNPRNVVAVAVLVVVATLFLWLASSLVRAISLRDELSAQVVSNQDVIAQIRRLQAAQPAALRKQIDDARSRLQPYLVGMPSIKQASDEISRYYGYASELGTQLMRMDTVLNPPAEERQTAYKVQRFYLDVRGPVPNLLRFLARASNGPFGTFFIDNIRVQPDGPALANADLVVYSSDLVTGAVPGAPAPPPSTVVPGQPSIPMPTRPFPATLEPTRPAGQAPATSAVRAGATSSPAIGRTPLLDVSAPTATRAPLVHIVRFGETLASISTRYQVSIADIMDANTMGSAVIHPGDKLIIPSR